MLSICTNTRNLGDYIVGSRKLTGRDDFVKAKLEEGYSFRLLSKELGVSYQTVINYVKGLDRHSKRRHTAISFREPLRSKDLAERYNVTTAAIRYGLRKGRIKGRRVGYRWIIIE